MAAIENGMIAATYCAPDAIKAISAMTVSTSLRGLVT